MKIFSLLLLVEVTTVFQYCGASKMLLIMAGGTKSHKHFYSSIIEALAERGHQMTFITPYKSSGNKTNVREILITENYQEMVLSNTFEISFTTITKNFQKYMPRMCVDSMLEDDVQRVLKEDFDLVFLPFSLSDCYFSVVFEKKVPFVYVFPNVLFGNYHISVGNIDYPSVVPISMLEMSYPMTFTQRMLNVIVSKTGDFYIPYIINPTIENECRKRGVWPVEMPSLSEMQRKSSLTIVNSVRALEKPPRPYIPTVVHAGGLHMKSTKPLAEELEQFIQASGDAGFIYFSLGSQATPSQMKEEHRKIILDVFRSLKQRVLWKWDEQEMEGLSPNIKLGKWFHQQDILGHPKIRLFITHGGFLSTLEATYFGVPVIGMPIFADQFQNVFQVKLDGWGLGVDWKDLTEDKFRTAVLEILGSESIREKVKTRSTLMKDQARTPKEEVQYWVEYVLRYNGAYHLQSPFSSMPWYEIYNVDVWTAIFLLLVSVILLISFGIRFCVKKCFRSSKRKRE